MDLNNGGQMLRRARPGVRVGELCRLRPSERNELRKVFAGTVFGTTRTFAATQDLRNRSEILDRIEGELVVHARAEDERSVADHPERVAVRRGLGDAGDRDVAGLRRVTFSTTTGLPQLPRACPPGGARRRRGRRPAKSRRGYAPFVPGSLLVHLRFPP